MLPTRSLSDHDIYKPLYQGHDSNMHEKSYSLQDMAFVINHKNFESLKYYLDKPTLEDKTNFSDSLFDSVKDNSNSDMSDFEPPPLPKMKKLVGKNKNKPATISKPPNTDKENSSNNANSMALAVPSNNAVDNIDLQVNPNASSASTQKVMQMYKQNPIGMFMGATLSNCTININMPK